MSFNPGDICIFQNPWCRCINDQATVQIIKIKPIPSIAIEWGAIFLLDSNCPICNIKHTSGYIIAPVYLQQEHIAMPCQLRKIDGDKDKKDKGIYNEPPKVKITGIPHKQNEPVKIRGI